MNVINTQSVHAMQALQGTHRTMAAKETQQATTQNAPLQDDVQFSAEALELGETRQTESSSAGIRFELVNRIKAEIAAGTYDTPDKMDIALDRMIGRMNPR